MKKILLLLFVSCLYVQGSSKPPVEEGKSIFTTRCASCHNINKVLTGPALAGIDERRSIDWIVNFVHSSQKMVQSGDPVAVELFNKFNKIPMPDHTDLSPDKIKSVVEYIKSESKAAGDEAPFAKPSKLRPAYTPLSITNMGFFAGYLVLVFVLIIALLLAVDIKEYERKLRR